MYMRVQPRCESFSDTTSLAAEEEWSSDAGAEAASIKQTMSNTMAGFKDRGDLLKNTQDKTESLHNAAREFRANARKLRQEAEANARARGVR